MDIIKKLLHCVQKNIAEDYYESKNAECIIRLDCHANDGTIQIGRFSTFYADIRPMIQFDNADMNNIRDYISNLFETASSNESYYIRFLDINDGDTWYHISKPEPIEIKLLDKSASLSDIIDKVNELVKEVNNIRMRC